MLRSLSKLPRRFDKRRHSTIPQPDRNPKLPPSKLFINNEWVDASSGKTYTAINPATEQPVTEVALGDIKDAELAVAAAKEAFKLGSVWRRMDASYRGILINRLADLIERDSSIISSLEVLECGKVYAATLKADLPTILNNFRYFAGFADKNEGKTAAPDGKFMAYSRHEPVGVVASICSWNYSAASLSFKLAPLLAAGCTTVIKPSRFSSLATLHIGKLVKEAGFPPGVVNIVTGPSNVGSTFAEHPDVDCVSFTGSTKVGVDVYRNGAETMKRMILELGGKSPDIILKDADVDKAVVHAEFAAFQNMGQCCCAGSIAFVHESIHDEFVDKMKQRLAKRRIGDPFDLEVDHGPQTTKDQAIKVMKYIEQGKREGATCEVGGNRLDGPGYFIQPTLFTNVTDEMTIAKEEIFGPVLQVSSYKTIDELIERANNSDYGLASFVFGNNMNDINRLIQCLRFGSVWVNCYFMITPQLPFGGYKMSGIGREGGSYGIKCFSEIKSIYFKTPTKNS